MRAVNRSDISSGVKDSTAHSPTLLRTSAANSPAVGWPAMRWDANKKPHARLGCDRAACPESTRLENGRGFSKQTK